MCHKPPYHSQTKQATPYKDGGSADNWKDSIRSNYEAHNCKNATLNMLQVKAKQARSPRQPGKYLLQACPELLHLVLT